MKTHLCLLGGEVMPNIIGVLQDHADRVIPVVSKETSRQLQAMQEALHLAGSRATFADELTVLPHDPAHCAEVLEKISHSTDGLVVNWTGGTKVMSYAARRFAELRRIPALYVNTATKEIVRELPSTGVQTEVFDPCALGLNVLSHLYAAGHTVDHGGSLREFHLRSYPAKELVAASEAILDARPAELNALRQLTPSSEGAVPLNRLDPHLLRKLEEAQLISKADASGGRCLSATTLCHPFHRQSNEEQNSVFMRASYVEVFLWSQLYQRAGLDDVAWHLVLNPGETGRVHEIDVAVAHEGRFLLAEVKSTVDAAELADLIAEQAFRSRHIGRLFAHWILYIHRFRSEYENARGILNSQEKRALEYGGRLFWRDDLETIPEKIRGILDAKKHVL